MRKQMHVGSQLGLLFERSLSYAQGRFLALLQNRSRLNVRNESRGLRNRAIERDRFKLAGADFVAPRGYCEIEEIHNVGHLSSQKVSTSGE